MTLQNKFSNKNIEEVSTGEVKTGSNGTILIVSAIGSCIAVVVFDKQRHKGGIAHVMLPGKAPEDYSKKLRYAEDAIEELLSKTVSHGSDKSEISICIAGGGNVLKHPDDTVCKANIKSVLDILENKKLTLNAHSIGGTKRRSVKLDINTGCISCSIADEDEFVMWKPD